MNLRKGLIDCVLDPLTFAALFQPIEAIAVSTAIDDVRFPVVVHVVTNDWKAGLAQLPVIVPLPLVRVRSNVLKPAVGCQQIGLPVSVNVGRTDTVSIFF